MKFSFFRNGFAAAMILLCVVPSALAQTPAFGGNYRDLRPEQKVLVERWIREYQSILKGRFDAGKLYDRLPLSARTTFEAVTHALLNTSLTSEDGKSLGKAIDLVDVVERVAGKVEGARGDHQFRIYVYLRSGAINRLYAAKEFRRAHDNTVFHIGYPINFRQNGGVPSIQFSLTRTGRRADIDVDYRSSSPVKALFNGHLSAANSDVRAGQNDQVHNRRWDGLSNWWRHLLGVLVSAGTAEDPTGSLVPGTESASRKLAHGTIHDAVYGYLSEWLIRQRPDNLLPLVSIKAFPCVAEFGGESRPESKLALARILQRLQDRNKALGKVERLEDVVAPVPYLLPGAVVASHPWETLFTVQHVPEDVAWAIDCRNRYKLQMAEAIPRPPHKLENTYVVSMRVKDPKQPNAFLVQTWRQEEGEWRLVSFDIKRNTTAPPANLLAPAEAAAPNSAAGRVSTEAGNLLSTWLVRKRPVEAAKFFLSESYACDAFAEEHAEGAGSSGGAGDAKLMRFLEEVVKLTVPNAQLEGVTSPAEAGHPEMAPVTHSRDAAFLLTKVTGSLQETSRCGYDSKSSRNGARVAAPAGEVMATVFRLVHQQSEQNAAVTLYWKKVQGEWRVSSYAVDYD